MADFNHNMLVLAREARGLTQAELASRASIGQGTLSKFETGLRCPPDSSISELASQLQFPEAFFRQQGKAYGFPPFHYRKRKKLPARALGRIVAEMNIRRLHVSKLILSFGLDEEIPEIDLDEYQGRSRQEPSPETIARSVRESWMLHGGPIGNMVELIEQHGGIVIPCDLESTLIDAMSQRIDRMPVLFFINTNAPADRIRYTLAHELGHMSLHTAALKSDEEMEREADEFAGAFLMPAQEIKPQLRRFDLRSVANLKRYWGVSMAAIGVRARHLNAISPYQYKTFWIEMGKLGYRKREPHEPQRETPRLLARMIDFHTSKLGYSPADMAELLCLTVNEYEEMYGYPSLFERKQGKGHLRLVR